MSARCAWTTAIAIRKYVEAAAASKGSAMNSAGVGGAVAAATAALANVLAVSHVPPPNPSY